MKKQGPTGSKNAHNGNGRTHTAPQDARQEEGSSSQGQTDSQRKPRSERENAFDASVWLLQGLAGFSEELRHNDLGLPQDFWVHAYAARREALLAARALVDAALEKCSSEEAAASKPPTKKPPHRGQVSIDFG